jgi:acetyl-CoA/propionyl-CoA carboxylase biotin carboxyl carrier protein
MFLSEHPDLIPPPAAAPDAGDGEAPDAPAELVAEVNGRRFVVRMPHGLADPGPASARNGRSLARPAAHGRPGGGGGASGDSADLTSPIQGTVLRVLVEPGQAVSQGDVICIVEAMKMENELVAHREGTVSELHVTPGSTVRIRDVVASIT